jgi:hypothetical protein
MIQFKKDAAIKALNDLTERVNSLYSAMLRTGQLINTSIKQRSQKGVGIEGKMPGYTPAYKKWKKKKGRQVSTRDLTFSGKMWVALTEALVGKNGVRLFFGSADEQKKAQGNTEVAPFFGMTKTENVIYDKFKNQIINNIHL